MKIEKFEDLEIWQNSMELILPIYEITYKEKISKDFGFKEQIRRAVISISNNIAEGFERQSNSEFIKFLFHAKGSAGEVRSMLYAAHKIGYITDIELKKYNNILVELSKHISNFIKYLKNPK